MIFEISNFHKSTFIISTSQITYDSDFSQNSTPKVPIFATNLSLRSRTLKSFSQFQPLSNPIPKNSHSHIQSLKV